MPVGAGVVIVGGGIAGASAADALRRGGYDGRITLLGEEPVPPYERPPLSKAFLRGQVAEDRLALHSAEDYARDGVEVRLGERAVALDAAQRRVALVSGRQIAYEHLIITTGSAPRRLPVPGADLPGVHTLRTLADARALAAEIAEVAARAADGGRVVVVGAGFIGAEVAAVCREQGAAVTLIEQLGAPLELVLGPALGAQVAALHRAHGVDLRLGQRVVAFRGRERVEAVETDAGERIRCALVVVGVGVVPADGWLAGSGVACADGVLVDATCQTNVPGIFAAGDVARWPYALPGSSSPENVRLEHWDNALRQPEVAARAILGAPAPYTAVPYFWSEQYDLTLHVVGLARGRHTLVTRGALDERTLVAFYLNQGRIAAALAVNQPRELVTLKRLVGTAPDARLLGDASVPLKALLASTRPA